MKTYISNLSDFEGKSVTLQGWVSHSRDSKGLVFIVLRDGTGFAQCVVSQEVVGDDQFNAAKSLNQESAVALTGTVVKDERQIGGYELQATGVEVISIAEEYPITPKEHGVDFLMDKRHLWLRSKRQWAIMRVRNRIIFAIHQFFQERGFIQMDAPLFTGNACEGTSTLFETDFYGDPAYLSQSGQLYGEAMAMAHSKIYTFGPTFRAEKSKTRRHLSEFWMIEPEMAFYDLDMDMDLIEDFVRFVIRRVLESSRTELELIERDIATLEKADAPFARITYDEAVQIIKGERDINGRNSIQTLQNDLKELKEQIAANEAEIQRREAHIKTPGLKKGEINFNVSQIAKLRAENKELEERAENIPQWLQSAKDFEYGNDLGGSDETIITRLFDTPVMVHRWPREVKAFYMKRDEQNPMLAKGVDLLAPEGFGEIVGGGERETDIEFLKKQIEHHQLPMKEFEWYLDLRRFGSVPHAGFGLGLERFVAYICGLKHIRETIPFPRMYGRLFP
ncbi:MAG: amino acid--tRNA ligase-related protein [Chitinophagales bacterium]|nr:amino acid--tRNA ligase-related protein [Chitinophagales bacterium]